MSMLPTTPFGRYGSNLELARVDSYETALDGERGVSEDETGPIPTGRLNLVMLDREGARTGVPFVLPTVGSSVFVGGLPELGTLCVVGFLQQQQPIVIGFLPKQLSTLIGTRKTLPNLQPGEVLMQASTPDADAEGIDHHFVGAAIKLDAYGRVIITAKGGYKLTTSFLLSDEYTPDVATLNDPISNEPIFLQEQIPGGTGRRVGAQGTTVWTYGKSKVERIGEDIDTQAEGKLVVMVRKGQSYQDRRGNRFAIDEDGNLIQEAPTGGLTTSTQGTVRVETGGGERYNNLRGYQRTVGGDHSTNIGGVRKLTIGSSLNPTSGEIKIVTGPGGSQEHVILGTKYIAALGGIVLASGLPLALLTPPPIAAPLLPGGIRAIAPTVGLGLTGVDPLLVLSTFTTFMTTLLTLLATTPTSFPGTPLLPGASALIATLPTAASKTVFGSP